MPAKFSVGSHGFGVSPWKAFDLIVDAVQREFDEADINLNIGAAAFGDEQGAIAAHWNRVCATRVTKPGIKLNITSDFFEHEDDVVRFLQRNSLNVYFCRETANINGPAGSADLAIASQRPLVVNESPMYRHIWSLIGAYGRNGGLRDLGNNQEAIDRLYNIWTPERMTADYERMLDITLRTVAPS